MIIRHLFLIMSILFSFCSNTKAENSSAVFYDSKPEKILIVYLTRTNNTKAVAQIIRKYVGGKMVKLELVTPYPENYRQIVGQVHNENETGYLPPLKTQIENIDQYDIIFIGFPTWDMQLPPPMKSFLHQNDLRGKTVIPFNTNGGYGVGSSFETVKKLCSESDVLEGFSIKGGLERDGILLSIKGEKAKVAEKKILEWLQEIKIM